MTLAEIKEKVEAIKVSRREKRLPSHEAAIARWRQQVIIENRERRRRQLEEQRQREVIRAATEVHPIVYNESHVATSNELIDIYGFSYRTQELRNPREDRDIVQLHEQMALADINDMNQRNQLAQEEVERQQLRDANQQSVFGEVFDKDLVEEEPKPREKIIHVENTRIVDLGD